MNSRLADGGDKIAAFERGVSDEDLHKAFETPGTVAYMVAESWLVAYRMVGYSLQVMLRIKLYDTGHGPEAVEEFLADEAAMFQLVVAG